MEAPAPSPTGGSINIILLASVFTLLCLCTFTVLVVLDIKKAMRKRAIWLPGKALVLSALTIQVLSFVSGTNMSLNSPDWNEDNTIYYMHLAVTDAGTVNIIVFLGYFLPAMLAGRSVHNWLATAASALGIFFPLKHLLSNKKPGEKKPVVNDAVYYETIPLACIVFLILLLGCTVLAGKSISRIMRQRISAVLRDEDFGALTKECNRSTAADATTRSCSWDDFQDKLFKSWIVARASQPDYVIARSVLSSAAGVVVTCSIIFSMYKYILFFIYFKEESNVWFALSPSSCSFLPLLGFVLVGWVVICCRWFSAVLYFPWHPTPFTLKRCFCVEDFWTRSLVDMIHKCEVKDWRYGVSKKSCFSLKGIVTKLKLHKLLHLLRVLPILVVLISKFCWLFSEMVLGMPTRFCLLLFKMVLSKLMPLCLLFMARSHKQYVYEDYSKIIEPMCMPGEDPLDLWKANISAINRIALLCKKGCENGSEYTKADSMFTQFSMEWADQGSELLDKLRKASLPQVATYFPNLEKQCWKMTAVSFISIIVELQKVKSARVTTAVKACSQAWDLLRFADSIDCHPQGEVSMDNFDKDTDEVSMAADGEFFRLQDSYEKLPELAPESSHHVTIDVAKNLSNAPRDKALLKREKLLDKMEGNANMNRDTKDHMKIVLSYNRYKLSKVMEEELRIDRVEDLVTWAESSLRNVIASGLSKIPNMLAGHCRKCAEGFDEDNIWEAIYLAGKVRGMMESWGLQLVQQRFNSVMEWTVQPQPLPSALHKESETTHLLTATGE